MRSFSLAITAILVLGFGAVALAQLAQTGAGGGAVFIPPVTGPLQLENASTAITMEDGTTNLCGEGSVSC